MTPPLTIKQRIWAIAQLCVAFSLILWHLGYPFTGYYTNIVSQRLLYHVALSPPGFEKLPKHEQEILLKSYAKLQKASERSFFEKSLDAIERLFWQLPPFEIAWILLGTAIPLFILLRWEGAQTAAWLLPLLVLCYGIDGKIRGAPLELTAEERLFPTERYLIEHYLPKPFSKEIFRQQQQLQQAWDTYLIKEWAKEVPAVNPKQFLEQKQRGHQAFTQARVKTLPSLSTAPKWIEPNWLVLVAYLLWNLFFAWGILSPRYYFLPQKMVR